MAYEQKLNSGALFKNKEKTNEKQPDYKGPVNVDGKDYWLSGWINQARGTGETYMKVLLTPKDAQPAAAPPPAKADADDPFADEIPF